MIGRFPTLFFGEWGGKNASYDQEQVVGGYLRPRSRVGIAAPAPFVETVAFERRWGRYAGPLWHFASAPPVAPVLVDNDPARVAIERFRVRSWAAAIIAGRTAFFERQQDAEAM
jgi:hypothetical protein